MTPISLLALLAVPDEPTGLTVVVQGRPATVYVGQAAEVFVGVVAGTATPRVVAPRVEGLAVVPAGVERKPWTVSSIGDLVTEQSLFRFRFRVVPRRAGSFRVGPFPAEAGKLRGVGPPWRLEARDLPQAGRPATFLGGVGTFDVRADARPSRVRVGQSFEYRVRVEGPGARGVRSAPDLARLKRSPAGFRIERLPDEVEEEPTTHTFVFRLRPIRGGDVTLPPVSVSGFDPRSRGYVTKVSNGVPVRVADVRAFDPDALDYRMTPEETPRAAVGLRSLGGWVAALAGAAVGCYAAWRSAHSRSRRVARLLRARRQRLGRSNGGEAEAAALFHEALGAYLALTTGRPPGALTPNEARTGIGAATGRPDIAERSADLVARSDRVRFGGGAGGDDPDLPSDVGRWLLAVERASKRVERQPTA